MCCVLLRLCVLGKRLLKDIDISNCSKTVGGPLFNQYCNGSSLSSCESYFKSELRLQ